MLGLTTKERFGPRVSVQEEAQKMVWVWIPVAYTFVGPPYIKHGPHMYEHPAYTVTHVGHASSSTRSPHSVHTSVQGVGCTRSLQTCVDKLFCTPSGLAGAQQCACAQEAYCLPNTLCMCDPSPQADPCGRHNPSVRPTAQPVRLVAHPCGLTFLGPFGLFFSLFLSLQGFLRF